MLFNGKREWKNGKVKKKPESNYFTKFMMTVLKLYNKDMNRRKLNRKPWKLKKSPVKNKFKNMKTNLEKPCWTNFIKTKNSKVKLSRKLKIRKFIRINNSKSLRTWIINWEWTIKNWKNALNKSNWKEKNCSTF